MAVPDTLALWLPTNQTGLPCQCFDSEAPNWKVSCCIGPILFQNFLSLHFSNGSDHVFWVPAFLAEPLRTWSRVHRRDQNKGSCTPRMGKRRSPTCRIGESWVPSEPECTRVLEKLEVRWTRRLIGNSKLSYQVDPLPRPHWKPASWMCFFIHAFFLPKP